MNIFVLDEDPIKAAQYQCDKHVVKMALESAQLLCSPFEKSVAPYKRTHYNHPCAKWARASRENYIWLFRHAMGLAEEYSFRYSKRHKSQDVIEWCGAHADVLLNLPPLQMTERPQALPEKYKNPDVVTAYRNYYLGDKAAFARWTRREQPDWWLTHEKLIQ